ncbi:hypothetical protein Tco_0258454, partial [Tanacetum coccineum]
MCDVPLCENTTPLNALNEHSEDVDDDNSSSDDDSPYGEERISHKKTKNQAKSDKTGHGME